jgi:hypothetical protein
LTLTLTPVPLGVDDGLGVPDPVVLVEGVLVAVSVTVGEAVRVPLLVGETEDVGVSAWRTTSRCAEEQRSELKAGAVMDTTSCLEATRAF